MMITRKTRFTSGLVAILMLVTMLAAFVLPVTAEELEFPGVQQMETLGRDSTSDWGINTPADWRAAVALSKTGEDFAGLTLHFTADIDFDENQDGTVEESEYVDTLVGIVEEKYVGFAGNIHGHGHVIKNLHIKHDISVNGQYVGLIGFGSKKNVVIRDLGIESGKIHATGKGGADYSDEDKMLYVGAFMGYSGNAITFANCWNGAEVYSDAHVYETDMATFGRLSAGTIVNCFNAGDLTVMTKGATSRDGDTYANGGTARIMPFFDWGTASCIVKNSFNVGALYGEGYSVSYKSLFSFGGGLDTPEEYQAVADSTKNVYSTGVSDFSNRGVDSYVTLSDFKTTEGDYVSGKLASQLNSNYDTTYDKEYGRKYYKVEDGKTVYAEDEYDAIFSLTLVKKLGDFVVETETSFYPATTVISIPTFKNYELSEDHSWEILIDKTTNTFPMPPANVYMTFASTTPDWDLVEKMIEKYSAYVETGHVATMAKETEVYELLGKLETIYGMKDTISADLAIKMIGQYAEEDLEFDLSPKEGLTYPNLPLARFYGSGAKGNWLIRDVADWRKAVELSDAGTSFSGVTFHFANDIDFENIPVDGLGRVTAFKGNIHGHGYSVKNLMIEHDVGEKGAYVGFIACASSGVVIRDLNLASGQIVVQNTTKGQNGKESYNGVFLGQGAGVTFANCWNNVDLIVDGANSKMSAGEEVELDLSASVFGRKASGKVINCINTGTITNKDKNIAGDKDDGGRVSIFAEWHNGNLEDGDIVYMSNVYSVGGHKAGSRYGSGLVAFSKSATAKGQGAYFKNAYSVGFNFEASKLASAELNTPDRVLNAGVDVTGELAWLMNLNYDTTYDAEYGRKYYTVKNGQTVFGTKQEQPVKVNIKVDGETVETVYAVAGIPLSLGYFYDNIQVVENYAASVNAENELILNSLPNGLEMTVNVEYAAGLDYSKLRATLQEMEQIENKDEYTSNVTADSMEETLKELKTKAYASQGEVNDAVALLNSYYRVLDIVSILECTDKNKMEAAYAVSTVKELEYLSTIKSWFDVNKEIYITADLDLTGWTKDTYPDIDGDVTDLSGLKASLSGESAPGGKAKIIGLTVSPDLKQYDSGWLGTYEGKSVKNLEFNKCSIAYSISTYTGILMGTFEGEKLTVENVSMVDCSFDQGGTSSEDGARGGGLIGRIIKGTVEFDNILLTGNKVKNIGRQNVGMLFGFNSGSVGIKVIVKNTISSDNTFEYTHDAKLYNYSPLIAEMNGDLTVENVGIFNNKTTAVSGITRTKNTAVICGYTKNTTALKVSNVLAYGNNLKTVYAKGSGATVVPAEKNVFAVASGSDTTLETITSGKALYEINATDPGQCWALVDGKPVFSATGITRKVTFDLAYGEDVALYTDSNGKLIGLTSAITNLLWDGYDDLNNAVFTKDTVIKQAVCDHTYTYTFDGTGKHTVKCTKNCGYEEQQDCTMETQVGNGTTHKKVCAVCEGEVAEACAKVMNHIYGMYDADSKHSEACTVCGYASAEVPCSFTDVKVEHTDSMNGYTRKTCACGYFYDIIESSKQHVWDTENKIVVKENTNGADGLVAIPCKHCSAVEYETIAAEVITEASIVLNSDIPYSKLPGEKFEIVVDLARNPGVNSIGIKVEYDPSVLKLDWDAFLAKYNADSTIGVYGVYKHEKFSSFTASQNDGVLRLNYLNLANVEDQRLTLATLTFEVLDAANLGVTDIRATLVKDANNPADTGVSNYAGENVAVKDAAAKVEIVGNLWADVNGDGLVNTYDATMILKWKVGNTFTAEEFDVKAADVDRNGIVEIADAVMVLQYAAGLVEWDPNGTTVAPATL